MVDYYVFYNGKKQQKTNPFLQLTQKLKLASNKNHYALKRKMIVAANRASHREIIKMKNMLKIASQDKSP